MELKRETKTLKWYAKDFVRAIKEEPADWTLAAYVAGGVVATCVGTGLGKVLIFLIDNLVM